MRFDSKNHYPEYYKNVFIEYCSIDMPSGTIEKIIGRKLTWDDEPVKI